MWSRKVESFECRNMELEKLLDEKETSKMQVVAESNHKLKHMRNIVKVCGFVGWLLKNGNSSLKHTKVQQHVCFAGV